MATGTPDIVWCEKQLCSWITTPANAWSNLAFIVVAMIFFVMTRKEKAPNIRYYGIAALWVGATSFIYHSSLTYATQVLDFLGMYIFFFLVLAQNFARLGWIACRRVKSTLWILTATTTVGSAIAAKYGMHLQPVVMVLILFILATEIVCANRAVRKIEFRNLAFCLVSLSVGAFFSASDVTRRICNPDNHFFQGHALWHILGAVSLFFSILHYRQFYSLETGKMLSNLLTED